MQKTTKYKGTVLRLLKTWPIQIFVDMWITAKNFMAKSMIQYTVPAQ